MSGGTITGQENRRMLADLTGNTALAMGAASGMGRGIAEVIAAFGRAYRRERATGR